MPSGVLSGWLEKRGGGSSMLGSTKYSNRWFVLDTEGKVRYFKAQPTRPSDLPQGLFSVLSADMRTTSKTDFEVTVPSSIEGMDGATLTQEERIYYLRAESAEDQNRWISALQAAASRFVEVPKVSAL
uniref:PH domain-containing protein n=1 Tax=Haptolina brevifila TaxID=156173 RepID=A0A7S2JM50_9EUKA|mmetsp:Transcript_8554/g.17355  ORF Transcript_8554/g.17355 Transcript_8554/m.17355 type:complete len:128 (+) Transcript_8554:122-505(+)